MICSTGPADRMLGPDIRYRHIVVLVVVEGREGAGLDGVRGGFVDGGEFVGG